MITYNRHAFGLNLIFRVHGSAVYRSIVPSLVAVGFFFLIRKYSDTKDFGEEIGHPYAIGVLVASTTFLIVFRANQGYSRYWEAAGAIHHMSSKWMDATIHTGVYHMQCDHYAHMKPPSYFDYPELNKLFMTRDRERSKSEKATANTFDSNNDSLSEIQLPEHSVEPTSGSGNKGHSLRRGETWASHQRKQDAKKRSKQVAVRAVTKSINFVENKKQRDKVDSMHHSDSELYKDRLFLDESNKYLTEDMDGPPAPLIGKGRLDGNWGKFFKDGKSTFFDKTNPDVMDPKGFASTQGGRTPALFLQELAHLSSLLVAVAYSTLRNDIEGATSPLDYYEPGSPWPEVDPDKDDWLKVNGPFAFLRVLKSFLGIGHTDEERTKYNSNRPLPVIGGVSDNEIKFLQMARGPYAKTQLVWNWVSEFCIREHLAGSTGKVGPPIISRVIQFLGDGMIYYNHARKIMFIPFPFVHAQLSVLFIIVMIPAIPFLMDQYTDDATVGSLLTFFTVMCLSGIHEVARELENPFRNVPNELPLVTLMAQYNEALITMFSGYHPDHFWDGERVMQKRAPPKKDAPRKVVSALPALPTQPATVPEVPAESSTTETNSGDSDTASPAESDREEIEKLKLQLAKQQKLIEQLAARVAMDPEKESEQIEKLAEDVSC